MKYPVDNNLAKIPKMNDEGKFQIYEITADFKYGERKGLADHHTFESCWICCRAYNNRVGYSDKEILKIIKLIEDEQEEKREKAEKGKSKKAKKGKKGKKDKGSEKAEKGKKSKKRDKLKKGKKK
tara:strand:+ start:7920 stop:8294 length:375 start_codon:yes stop_codon:yes gene_type:complete